MQVEAQRRRLTVGTGDPNLPRGAGGGSPAVIDLDFLQTTFPDDEVKVILTKTDQERQRKRPFAEKDFEGLSTKPSTSYDNDAAKKKEFENTFCASFTCRKGMKPESPNQDSYVVVVNKGKWSVYGVFDGHGPSGHDASDFSIRALVKKFLTLDGFVDDPITAFQTAFRHCQAELENGSRAKNFSTSGSTCTMAFHDLLKDNLTIAYVGDSRAVLFECKQAKLIHETEDHKPNLPAEKARIESNGGRVVFDGYYNYRVFAKTGMYPGLNMSRALGDIVAHKEAGLTADPECKTISLASHRGEGSELLLLICSDGVWEFIESPEGAKEFKGSAKNLKDVDMANQAEKLAQSSWDKWMADSDNEISDDITVIAIAL